MLDRIVLLRITNAAEANQLLIKNNDKCMELLMEVLRTDMSSDVRRKLNQVAMWIDAATQYSSLSLCDLNQAKLNIELNQIDASHAG